MVQANVVSYGAPIGIRTRVSSLKGMRPNPIRRQEQRKLFELLRARLTILISTIVDVHI